MNHLKNCLITFLDRLKIFEEIFGRLNITNLCISAVLREDVTSLVCVFG